jgi:hypothetical protein
VRAAVQAADELTGVRGVARLAEDVAVERDVGVGAENEIAGDGQRLAAGVLQGDLARIALGELIDVRRPDLELEARLGEDRAPLRRRAREDQRSGKNSAASRWPDSGESDPWTMFWPTAIAKSPRIEPGLASSGFVAPMT